MTVAPALSCPLCKRPLGPELWKGEHEGYCFFCHAQFEFLRFPALEATATTVAPQAAVIEADSVCFFHAENRAEAVCDSCGRLLCLVCAVPLAGQKLCPACIASGHTANSAAFVRDRVLWDGIAVVLAIVPLIVWPFTVVTAPVALGMVFYGWKKPCSLVRGPSRWRFILAALFSVVEIGVWIVVGVMLWLR